MRFLPLLLLPLLLLRGALDGSMPGAAFGEGWGRIFVAEQLRRWVGGEAPWGRADLLVEPIPLWPVDLVPTALLAALRGLGDGPAMAASMAILMGVAGLGGYAAARQLGAPVAGALAAGVGLQLHPFLLRNAMDGVMEVVALGFVPLALAALVAALRRPGPGPAARLALAAWALGASNPYGAVHAALAGLVALPWLLWRFGLRKVAGLSLLMALGVGLAAAPVIRAEHREGGRMSEAWRGGFSPSPGPMRQAAAARGPRADEGPRRAGDEAAGRAGSRPGPRADAPPRLPPLARLPGGTVSLVGLLLAFAFRPARPLAVVGLVAWLAGPAPAQLGRLFDPGSGYRFDLVQSLLQLLPLGLGNPQRGILLFVVPAWLAIARTPLALPAAVLALGEAALTAPGLRIPTVELVVDDALLAELEGAVVTFPCGDPPIYNPGVPPKFALWLASRHGHPVASDYGRGAMPLDAGLLRALSEAGGIPVAAAVPEAEAEGFGSVLVLYDFLPPQGREAVSGWLQARYGPPQAESDWGGVWRLPEM